MRLLLLALAVALTGCGQSRPAKPIAAQCDNACFVPCVGKDGDTGVRIEGDPNDPNTWDEIGDALNRKFPALLRTCDARREACTKCLRRLDDEKVISL